MAALDYSTKDISFDLFQSSMKSKIAADYTAANAPNIFNSPPQIPKNKTDDNIVSDILLEVEKLTTQIDKSIASHNMYFDNILLTEVMKKLLETLEAVDKELLKFSDGQGRSFSEKLTSCKEKVTSNLERVFVGECDEFGIPIAPLRSEVLGFLERVKNKDNVVVSHPEIKKLSKDGQKYFPEYKRGKWSGKPKDEDRNVWENPLDYLEFVFGKYLSKYNQSKEDYIYWDELSKLFPKYRNTLNVYLIRHSSKPDFSSIGDYIPLKSVRLDKEAGIILKRKNIGSQSKKYFSLNKTRG